MKKNISKILLAIVSFWVFALSQITAASPQSAAPWIVSSALYADKESSMPQIDYTREFRHINLPEFWIDRAEEPDRIIMNREQIRQFNKKTEMVKGLITPARDFNTTYSGEWIKTKLISLHAFLNKRAFYLENGKAIERDMPQSLWDNSRYETVPKTVTTRYALVVNYTHHRVTPTNITLLKTPQQRYFDRNQNAALDIGTPLAVLIQSADKKWYFALSPSSYGWVSAEDIAFTTREKMLRFSESRNFVVTINPKNAILINGRYDDFVRMGVRLPYAGRLGAYAQVKIPKRDTNGVLSLRNAAIKCTDTHLGYLPYTPRTIITQAFKFLNAPYGWGGMFGEQDCSKFLQEVYAVAGIMLPRNSGDQEQAAKPLIIFENGAKERMTNLTQKGESGTTLLHLPGHIMLYLGSYKGTPYIIHAVWGAVEGKNPLAKTAVTSVLFKNYIEKMDTAVAIKP
ncbi:MAG: SH3 domain-containing protein [Campylobacterota bacterium]|nr:SH3 domain-containing protein [Campylobacterota bacterium]